jgi:hypothetical protein
MEKEIKLTKEQVKSLITHGKIRVGENIITALYSPKTGKSIIEEMFGDITRLKRIEDNITEMMHVSFKCKPNTFK